MKYFDWSNTINGSELIETIEVLNNEEIVVLLTENIICFSR